MSLFRRSRPVVVGVAATCLPAAVLWLGCGRVYGWSLLYGRIAEGLPAACMLCSGSDLPPAAPRERFVEVLRRHSIRVEEEQDSWCRGGPEVPDRVGEYRLLVRVRTHLGVIAFVDVSVTPVPETRDGLVQAGWGWRGWYVFGFYRWFTLREEEWRT